MKKKCVLLINILILISMQLFYQIAFSATLSDKLEKLKDLYKKHKYTQAVNFIDSNYEFQEIFEREENNKLLNYQYLIARSYNRAKIYDKAINYYSRIAQKDIILSDYALFYMAECYQNTKKYQFAINYYEILNKTYPLSFYLTYDAFYNMSECYEKLGKYQEGLDELNKISEKAPIWNPSKILFKKAHLYELTKNWTETLLTNQKLISLYPKSPFTSEALKRIKFIENNYPTFKFKIETGHIWDRGIAYYSSNEYKNAIAEFKKIINEKKNENLESNCYNMIGKAYFKSYNFWKAIEYFKIATQKYPESEKYTDSLFELANSYLRVRNSDSALWIYKKIDTEYSNSGYGDSALYKIACFYEAQKKHNESIDIYLQLLEKYPKSSYCDTAYWEIAGMYLQQNNFDKAIKYFEMLYKNFPNSKFASESYYWVGKCYEKQDNFASASEIYKKMLISNKNKNFFNYQAKERLSWINFNKYKCLSFEQKKEIFNLALKHYEKEDYPKAIENFRKIIYLYDNTDESTQSLKLAENCYKKLKMWPKILNNKDVFSVDEIITLLINQYVYEKKYDNRLKYLNTFKELFSLGLYEEAIVEIEKLRKIDYKDADLIYIQMIASKESEQYYSSITSTENLVKLITDKENREYLKDESFLPLSLKRFLYPTYYSEYVEKYAKDYDVDPLFIYAIIRKESMFKNQSRSYASAFGLMQIIPATGKFIAQQLGIRKFSVDQLYDPETNIKMGIWYVRYLLDEFEGNKFYTLAGYNGGPNNSKYWLKKCSDKNDIDEFISKIKFIETHDYVKKVMISYNRYKEIYAFNNP